jgi:hypothetical protein
MKKEDLEKIKRLTESWQIAQNANEKQAIMREIISLARASKLILKNKDKFIKSGIDNAVHALQIPSLREAMRDYLILEHIKGRTNLLDELKENNLLVTWIKNKSDINPKNILSDLKRIAAVPVDSPADTIYPMNNLPNLTHIPEGIQIGSEKISQSLPDAAHAISQYTDPTISDNDLGIAAKKTGGAFNFIADAMTKVTGATPAWLLAKDMFGPIVGSVLNLAAFALSIRLLAKAEKKDGTLIGNVVVTFAKAALTTIAAVSAIALITTGAALIGAAAPYLISAAAGVSAAYHAGHTVYNFAKAITHWNDHKERTLYLAKTKSSLKSFILTSVITVASLGLAVMKGASLVLGVGSAVAGLIGMGRGILHRVDEKKRNQLIQDAKNNENINEKKEENENNNNLRHGKSRSLSSVASIAKNDKGFLDSKRINKNRSMSEPHIKTPIKPSSSPISAPRKEVIISSDNKLEIPRFIRK